ncbi:MAG TPA: heme exporter protein CcmD [Burkholderiales bacterium]|nr:heme exporter protein CcmD [Burkholderiales bacterium]
MNWASWSDFFAMGGYAIYVWGSYGVTACLIVVEITLLRARGRTAAGGIARRDAGNRP